ncbi:MAG: hypothetical protein KatS3mg050_4626 [Litorilinea sp.]|nr:MAG: hypothetical protein KatS3mg050_4626 [Litorilinea sp.]
MVMNSFSQLDADLIAEQEALWTALNRFLNRLTSAEWSHPHGKTWTFADVPYHLAIFNRLLVDAIEQGTAVVEPEAITTLAELDAWNQAQFARRPIGQTGRQAFDTMRSSQDALRTLLHRLLDHHGPQVLDWPVWLPILRVRGWRTLRLALEYNLWHQWFHFVEAQLRRDNTLPHLPPSLVERALNFHMELSAGAVTPTRQVLRWTLSLSGEGGGEWTFYVGDGGCQVEPGAVDAPDIRMETDIATYLKVSAFALQNPMLAMLKGQIKVQGLTRVGQLQRLFAVNPDHVWPPMARGAAVPAGE